MSKTTSPPLARPPFIIGVTGAIGTGKTTAAAMLRRLDIPVQASDQEVHYLLEKDPRVFQAISELFPHCIRFPLPENRQNPSTLHKIDRQALGQHVFNHPNALKHLENLLHPMVRARHEDFIETHRAQKTPLIALDIPLLFEAGYEPLCDTIITTTCTLALQQERVLKRPGMGLEKLHKILEHQLSSAEKQSRADYVLETSDSQEDTFQHLCLILEDIRRLSGQKKT